MGDLSGTPLTRVLLIGKGSIANRHKQAILDVLPSAEIVHMGTRELDNFLDRNGAEFPLSDLESFDFAVVTSPASHHAKHVSIASKAGVPVLVEKPLASSLSEAIELAQSLAQENIPVQIGYVLRHSEGFRIFREQLMHIGVSNIRQVTSVCHSYLPQWRPDKDYRTSVSATPSLGGGALRELSHELDYLLELFGSLTVNSAVLEGHPDVESGVETMAQVRGCLPEGARVDIRLDMFEQEVERWCEVEWTDGTRLRWDIGDNSVQLSKNLETIQQWVSSGNRDDWFKKQVQVFLDVLETEEKPNPSIDDGVEVMKLIDEIERSASWLK